MMPWYALCWALCTLQLPGLSTGKLIREEITLTWDLGAPNGHVREMIKMNGDFPGPSFVWDEDDDIEVILSFTFLFQGKIVTSETSGHCSQQNAIQLQYPLAWIDVSLYFKCDPFHL